MRTKRGEKKDISFDEDVIYISEPWDVFHSSIIRTLSHLHLSSSIYSKIHLPFRGIWNKLILKNTFCDGLPINVILNAHFFSLAFTGIKKYVRQNFNGGKIVLEFPDRYEYFKRNYKDFPSLDKLNELFDLIITYNTSDSKTYGFKLSPPSIGDYSFVKDDNSIPKADVFFVGNNKGRLQQIHSIYDTCISAGLKCDFHIVGVGEDEELRNGIVYNMPIEYEEVLRRVKRANCVLNLTQTNGDGITLRDYEAMGLDKLLLTNNQAIRDTLFYHEDQIIWIEDLRNRITDIKNGFSGHRYYSLQYSPQKRFEWISDELRNNMDKKSEGKQDIIL